MDSGESYAFSFEKSRFMPVDIEAANLGTTVVPVTISYDGKTNTVAGTAFCAAKFDSGQALFITAKHVIEPLIEDPTMRAYLALRGKLRGDPSPYLYGAAIDFISAAQSHNDTAILRIDMKNMSELDRERYRLYVLPAVFDIPQVGEPCLALGYHSSPAINGIAMQASQGRIEEIHHTRRDSVLSTFPTFRTDAWYRPGMSGGPIIDTKGRAIGVVSHGNEADNPENVVGYGACLGAILEMEVELFDVAGTQHVLSIVDLANDGYLGDRDDHVITLARGDNGGLSLSWADPPENTDDDNRPRAARYKVHRETGNTI